LFNLYKIFIPLAHILYSAYTLKPNFAVQLNKSTVAKPQKKSETENNQSYSHLKWPAIIIGILVVILVILFDYCSRQGTI